jgi:hypothetical protein
MEYFGFTLSVSHADDVPVVINHLKANLAALLTSDVQIAHWHKDNVGFKETSPHYPDEVWFDAIPRENKNWDKIYQALLAISPQLQGKIAIEYQHPERPDDPYYMLVFDKNGISLGDDSQWEETMDIQIIQANYLLK